MISCAKPTGIVARSDASMACVWAMWLNSGLMKLTFCTDFTLLKPTQCP
jgi:hypothetical protein